LQAIARAVRVNGDHQGGATVVDYGLGGVGLTGAKRSTGGIVQPSLGGERLYSTEEAAEILQLNVQTVRKHLRIRKIGGHCDRSGRWWIRQSDIEAFLTARRKVHGA
jgi:excisionase family DNA binding protein